MDTARSRACLPNRCGFAFRRFLLLFVLFDVAAVAGWIFFFPNLTGWYVESNTGSSFSAQSCSSNPFRADFSLEDAVIGQPEGFADESNFMEVNRFDLQIDLPSFGRDTLIVVDAVIDIPKVTIIINERSQLNLDRFLINLIGERRGSRSGMTFRNVSLAIGDLEVVDLSKPLVDRSTRALNLHIEGYAAQGARDLFRPLFEIAARSGYDFMEASEARPSAVGAR